MSTAGSFTPTGFRMQPYYDGSKSCLVTLFINVIATSVLTLVADFAPYWLSVWRVPSTFHKLGLWWFCIYGYRDPRDYYGKVYAGCWWYFSPYLDDIRDQIAPVWFRVVQFFVTINVIVSLLAVVFLVFFYFTPRRKWALVTVGALSAASCFLMTLSCVIFAANGRNEGWMPQPEQNRFDWAFGFAGLACFTSLFGAVIAFVYIRWLAWYEDRILEHLLQIDEQNKKEPIPGMDLDGMSQDSATAWSPASREAKSRSLIARCQVPSFPPSSPRYASKHATNDLDSAATTPLGSVAEEDAVAVDPKKETKIEFVAPELEFDDSSLTMGAVA